MKSYLAATFLSLTLIIGFLGARQLQTVQADDPTSVYLPFVAKSVPSVFKIAFSLSHSTGQDLYVMDEDGSNISGVITSSATEAWPLWSPDGRQLAFRLRETARDVLIVTDVNGSVARTAFDTLDLLGNGVTIGNAFAWSNDGSQLALYTEGAVTGLFVANADGSGTQTLASDSAETIRDPSWSPTTDTLVFVSQTVVSNTLQASIKATSIDTVTPTVLYGPLDNHTFYATTFSPDGKQIAFVDHEAPFSTLSGQLVIMNADGGGIQRFGAPFPLQTGLSWSPDGTKLAFIGENDNGNIRASIVNVDDGSWSQSLLPADVRSRVSWTADSNGIIFDAPNPDPTTRNLYRCELDCAFTSLFTNASPNEQYLQPTLSPRPLP